MTKPEKLPSEIISDFLEYMESCQTNFQENRDAVEKADKQVSAFAHEFEFADGKAERNKLATAFQMQRKSRRKAKDAMLLYEKISKFASSQENKAFLRKLKGLVKEQETTEQYLRSERVYKRKGEVLNENTDA